MAQDYIKRLVEQVAAMLAAILARRRAGLSDEARQELEALSLQTVGRPLDTIKRMTPDALRALLEASGANRHLRAVMLAELLMQDAEIIESQGDPPVALASWLHAFCLLIDSMDVLSAEEQAMYRPKVAMLAAKLEPLPPNPYVTERLRAYRVDATSAGNNATGPPANARAGR